MSVQSSFFISDLLAFSTEGASFFYLFLGLSVVALALYVLVRISYELLVLAEVPDLVPWDEYRSSSSSCLLYGSVLACALSAFLSGSYLLCPPASLLLLSGLLIGARTDLEISAVPEIVLKPLIFIGLVCAGTGFLPISFTESCGAAFVGYAFLRITRELYWRYAGVAGLGEADEDVVGAIGAFLGFIGIWTAVMIASLCGVSFFLFAAIWSQQPLLFERKLPFVPFLTIGAFTALFFHEHVLAFFQ